jgi:apurinic endonuclease APN1
MNDLYLGIHYNEEEFSPSILKALEKAKNIGANVLQIFNGNKRLSTLREKINLSNQDGKEIKLFLKDNKMKLFIHSILILNYCKDPESPRNRWGIDNIIYDINSAKKVGASGVVLHMGSYKTEKINLSYEECISNFIKSLTIILKETSKRKVPILLETPVARKFMVCGTTELFAKLYSKIPLVYRNRIKFCIDTQHIFASGYNISNKNVVRDYFDQFNRLIGIKNIKLIHLNDSKNEFDVRIDRHQSIGKGFIFSKDKESLVYILLYCMKRKIPIVLETGKSNYVREIKFLKSLVMNMEGGSKKKDLKPLLLKIFNAILDYYENTYNAKNIKNKYRIESYKKAIKVINNFKGPIYNSSNVQDLPSIGKGFIEKINSISKTGTLNLYENIKKNNRSVVINAIKLFKNIWGVGDILAKKIVSKKIYNIKELKDAIEKGDLVFTRQQMLGLKYYDDLNEKIPRNEVKVYTDLLKALLKEYNVTIYNAGSYLAKKKFCGDIDLIISYNSDYNLVNLKKEIYEIMEKESIIKETLSYGTEKSIIIVKLDNYKYYRKMDIAFVNKKYLYFYLLYFGSGRDFSKKIRAIASKRGYKLNEKGLFDKNNRRINFNPKSEEDIFKYLGANYVEHEDRI